MSSVPPQSGSRSHGGSVSFLGTESHARGWRHHFRIARKNEAAGAADAAAWVRSTAVVFRPDKLRVKGGCPCDPLENHAGGTPATSLSEATHNAISAWWKGFAHTSTALPIASARDIFGNTKPTFRCRSCRRLVTTSVCPAVFLIQTLQEAVEHCRHAYPRKPRLPTILSQEEVAQLIDAACTHFIELSHDPLCTGVRDAELTRLKVSDIDSRRIVIHIQGGKGSQAAT